MSRLRSLPVEQPCHFRDRLGERSIRTVAGDTVEVLRVCRELASVRVAIRDRVARLSTLRLARFVPVRSTDEVPDDPNGFEIVSDYIPGTRLSDILHAEGARRTVVPTDAALHVVRQLLGALATLHQTRAVTHGAIAPERLIVTPRGHLVVADCVLGLALDRLSFSRAKLWSEFRIPMPPGSDFPRFDQPADIAQIGFVAVALLASRPLEASDYPDRLLSLIDSLTVTDGGDARVPIPKALRAWLKTALKVETRSRFATVRDAQTAFEQALSNRRRPASAENPIKSLVDDPNRARTDGYGETRSTTDAVESRIDVDIPARELLPHASDENWDTDPRGVAPDPPPRFTPPDEALVSQYVGAALRVDDSVNQPPVTLVRHQPGRAGSAAGGATLGWLRRVARATGRAALVVGAATLHGPAWVLRTIGRAASAAGGATLGGLTRVGRATGRVARGTSRAALVVGAATLHGPTWVLRTIGRAASAAGGATLGGLTRVGRATGLAARGTSRAALVVGAATLHGPAWVLRTIGRAGSAAGGATLWWLTQVARGTARAARETGRVALMIGAATLHGPAWVLRAIGPAGTAAGVATLGGLTRAARATAYAARATERAARETVRAARETVRAALVIGAAAMRGPVSVLRAIGRAGSATGGATLWRLTRVARGTARAARETAPAAIAVGTAAAHGPAWALRAIGRAGTATGGATLGGLTRVARATARAARETAPAALTIGAATLHGPAWVLRAIGRAVSMVGRATLGGLTRVGRSTARVARGTARAALAIGTATLHGPAWVLRAIGRAGSTVGRATFGGLAGVVRATGRAARETVRTTYMIGSSTFLVRHARQPLVGRQLVFSALLVVAVWPGLLLATPQGRGLLQLWIEDVESAAGKHGLTKVPQVVPARPIALRVQSEPTGAQVWLDGTLKGKTPLALAYVKQGAHAVVLRHAAGSVRTSVHVGRGETSDLLVPIYPGWLAVFAPVELQVLEGGVVIGTTEGGRLLVRPGDHTLELVSARLGFKVTRTIEVKPGEVVAVNVELPPAPLEIVAPEGAEIWVDGLLIGTTPLEPQPVTIGTRDVVMRHPVLGEQRQTTTVTCGTPNRVVFMSPM